MHPVCSSLGDFCHHPEMVAFLAWAQCPAWDTSSLMCHRWEQVRALGSMALCCHVSDESVGPEVAGGGSSSKDAYSGHTLRHIP